MDEIEGPPKYKRKFRCLPRYYEAESDSALIVEEQVMQSVKQANQPGEVEIKECDDNAVMNDENSDKIRNDDENGKREGIDDGIDENPSRLPQKKGAFGQKREGNDEEFGKREENDDHSEDDDSPNSGEKQKQEQTEAALLEVTQNLSRTLKSKEGKQALAQNEVLKK